MCDSHLATGQRETPEQNDPYVDLHLHTDNSLLDGVGTAEEYAIRAKKYGRKYLCVTDHGNMTVVPQLLEACNKHGLRPVIGIEAYLNDYNHLVPEYSKLNDDEKALVRKNNHLLLLAMNTRGYKKLIRLSNEAQIQDAKLGVPEGACGFYSKPRMSWKRVAEECGNGDVICLSGCISSQIQQALIGGDIGRGREALKPYLEVFGPDRLYIEWMMIKYDVQDANLPLLFRLAEENGLPKVLTNDVHYCDERDEILQRVQMIIAKPGATLANPAGALEIDSNALWMMSSKDHFRRWNSLYKSIVPQDVLIESILETQRVAERCASNIEFDFDLKLPEIENADAELIKLTEIGLKKRGKWGNPAYMRQAREELETIIEKGFSSYFIIVYRVIQYAISIGAPPGSGRGSACGSLVTYALEITDIDPMEHGLLFWRFLSPNRGGAFIKLGL